MLRQFILVARREFLIRLRARSFYVSTLTSILVIAMIALLPQLRTVAAGSFSSGRVVTIRMTCREQRLCAHLAADLMRQPNAPALVSAMQDMGAVDGYLFVRTMPSGRIKGVFREQSRNASSVEASIRIVLQAAGWRYRHAMRLPTDSDLVVAVDRPSAKPIAPPQLPHALGVSFIILLYLAVITYGIIIAGSIVEEKHTRTLELLLSSARAPALLWGKLLGIGALGLVQLSLTLAGVSAIISGASALKIGPVTSGASEAVLPTPSALVFVLVFFVLGYFSFAAVFAAFGAAVADGERMRQYATIFYLPLYAAFYFALTAGNSPLPFERLLSVLPLFSPMMMFARLMTGDIGTLDLISAVISSCAFIALALVVASHLYTTPALLRLAPRAFARGAK